MLPSGVRSATGLGRRPLEREQGLEIFERALPHKLTRFGPALATREKIRKLPPVQKISVSSRNGTKKQISPA